MADLRISQLTALATFANDDLLAIVDTSATETKKVEWGAIKTALAGVFWAYDGNTVGSEKWIGTIDNFDFPIKVNNTERMVVAASTGNVGVGVAVPTARLHVVGSGTTSATINFITANSDSSKSFVHYDSGLIARDGDVYSITSATTTSWGYSAGEAANTLSTNSVFVGYSAGIACTTANVVIISGDSNNTTSANYGTGTVAIGNGAIIGTTGSYNVAYGVSAGSRTTTGGSNVYLGSYADRNDSSSTLSNITGNYNIVIGSLNQGASSGTSFVGGNAFSSNFVVHGIGTASNQIVFGGGIADTYFTDFYIGKGVTNTSPTAITIHATSGSGTDIAGANLQYAIGQATGSGASGDHLWYYAPSGSTGTTLTTLTEAMRLKGTTGELQVVNGVSIGTAGSVLGLLKLNGNTSGTVTINTAAAAGTWTLTLPTTDGNAGEYLQTDGAGVTTWAAVSGSGANTALSNLASVAINTTLLPGSNDGAALGSGTFSFSDLFLASGAVVNFANGNSVLTHSSGILTVSTGDLRVTTAGTNAASVATLDGTQTLTNKSIVATQLTGTAYTMAVNNTSGAAAYTLVNYQDEAIATYGGTFTWTGSVAPATIVSQQFKWQRIGSFVILNVSVLYTTPGTANTACIITLPATCPNPAVIANSGDAASEYMYPICGGRAEANQTANPSAVRGGIRRNAGDTAFEILTIFGSVNALQLQMTIIYPTA